jgi:predicted small lipoprotein YifL
MKIRALSGARTKTFSWLMALMVLAFMSSACGQTGAAPEDNPDDAPSANAPKENAPADDQGEDQADDGDNDNT